MAPRSRPWASTIRRGASPPATATLTCPFPQVCSWAALLLPARRDHRTCGVSSGHGPEPHGESGQHPHPHPRGQHFCRAGVHLRAALCRGHSFQQAPGTAGGRPQGPGSRHCLCQMTPPSRGLRVSCVSPVPSHLNQLRPPPASGHAGPYTGRPPGHAPASVQASP